MVDRPDEIIDDVDVRIVPAIPADGTTIFAVQKLFRDGNNETSVTLDFWCSSGSWSPVSVTVDPDGVAQVGLGMYEQIFVVSLLPGNTSVECTVTEQPVDGYDTEYYCPAGDSMSDANEICRRPNVGKPVNTSCKWTGVETGDANRCFIANNPAPVKVEVTKKWEITTDGGDYFDRDAKIKIRCDGEIINYDYEKNDVWTKKFFLSDGLDSYDDKDGIDISEATVTAWVYPEWEPTPPVTIPPTKQEGTDCWAEEDDLVNAVEVTTDCGNRDKPGMTVSVQEGGDSCTMINTLFFEGIPTLNQYGMAITALLMLGIGMLGFRRFA